MNNLIKKNLTYIILALMLLWGVGMAFALPPVAAAGLFCGLIVSTANVTVGKSTLYQWLL